MDQHEDSKETGTLSSDRLDTLLRALSAEPRRMVYAYLAEHGSAPVADLTEVVVGWSRTRDRTDTAANWTQTHVALHHQHLPALDDAGIISYDSHRGTATLSSLSPPVTEVVSTIVDLDTTRPDDEH